MKNLKNLNMYTVIIRKEHCEGAYYSSNDDCALCRAIREQLPELRLRRVGGESVWTEDGKFAITSLWGPQHFLAILSGKLYDYPVSFESIKVDPVIEAQQIINEPVLV